MKRYWLPILLFIVAFVIFYIGLAVGLIHNPNMGTLLWLFAAVVAIFGVIRLRAIQSEQE